jgi:zinc D-Ala-D-Ala carboxypeptidase
VNLSPHFTLEEMVFSEIALRKGLDNVPSMTQAACLATLCHTLLEPARELLGAPLRIHSGYRSPAVNEAVGGAATSAHMDGRAADFVPVDLPLLNAFHALRTSQLPYSQIIFECASWIHIAIATPGIKPAREALTATGRPGNWRYERVA